MIDHDNTCIWKCFILLNAASLKTIYSGIGSECKSFLQSDCACLWALRLNMKTLSKKTLIACFNSVRLARDDASRFDCRNEHMELEVVINYCGFGQRWVMWPFFFFFEGGSKWPKLQIYTDRKIAVSFHSTYGFLVPKCRVCNLRSHFPGYWWGSFAAAAVSPAESSRSRRRLPALGTHTPHTPSSFSSISPRYFTRGALNALLPSPLPLFGLCADLRPG